MKSDLLEIDTTGRTIIDLTGEVSRFCKEKGDGLCNVFVPHATAGVAIFELGAGSDEDLENLLDELFPRDNRWIHRHGSAGHGRDHVIPAFISPSITVPVIDGKLALGTWQYVAMVDTNRDNPERKVRLTFL